MMIGHFELKKASDGQFMFNLKASNGEIILTSERYTTKAAALNGIESVQKNATDEAHFELKVASSNKPYFVLKARNHQVIGQSQLYSSDVSAQNGIHSVMKNGVSTDIRDLTVGDK
ncbi:MAG: YegP family protein [Plesiomonas shigelloides]